MTPIRITAVLESESIATTGADLKNFVRKIFNILQIFFNAKGAKPKAKI